MEKERAKQIADIILDQLGGNQFRAMTGAKNFSFSPNGSLSFRIGRNKPRWMFCQIVLNGYDLYDMIFTRYRKGIRTSEQTISDVYNDGLQHAFTAETGLYTHL